MPLGYKIALLGAGFVYPTVLTAGADSLSLCKSADAKDDNDFEISLKTILERYSNKDLVNSYKKVQRKYYPEKDVLVKDKK